MGSVTEAKIGASYVNKTEATPIRATLEGIGHTQPPTPMQLDNNNTVSFANGAIQQKRSKPLTRVYIISKAVKDRGILLFIGGQVLRTLDITPPRIIILCIKISYA